MSNDVTSRLHTLFPVGTQFSQAELWQRIRNWKVDRHTKNSSIQDLLDSGCFERVDNSHVEYSGRRPVLYIRAK